MKNDLSHRDANNVLDFIGSTLDCDSRSEFRELIKRLKSLIGFSHARCGLGDCAQYGRKKMGAFEMLTCFPAPWEERYARKDYYLHDNIAQTAFRRKGLLYWADHCKIRGAGKKRNTASRQIMAEAASVGLKDGWLFSLQGRRSTECAIISLAGQHVEKTDFARIILSHTMPHLGQVVAKLLRLKPKEQKAPLTGRETEILTWIAAGKTAWDISVILNISHRTVEFHMGTILRKLDAVNAPQAVAIAMHGGILP